MLGVCPGLFPLLIRQRQRVFFTLAAPFLSVTKIAYNTPSRIGRAAFCLASSPLLISSGAMGLWGCAGCLILKKRFYNLVRAFLLARSGYKKQNFLTPPCRLGLQLHSNSIPCTVKIYAHVLIYPFMLAPPPLWLPLPRPDFFRPGVLILSGLGSEIVKILTIGLHSQNVSFSLALPPPVAVRFSVGCGGGFI